ncbi:MAG: Crp/Fnr family transcriptional regulator [Firmicutes bacterium]|nr:Crp/Fnr family transcriptional regulator [Bacillota bacterium]
MGRVSNSDYSQLHQADDSVAERSMAEFLRQVELFSDLSDEELARVAAIAQERIYKKGNHIFFEGDPGGAMFIVKDGAVRIYRLSAGGREKTLAMVSRGDCFGEMSLLDAFPRSAGAQALEDARLIMISREHFLDIMASIPKIALKVIRVLTARLREADQQIEYLSFGDARSRIVSTLLDLLRKHSRPGPYGYTIDLKLTHQELANLSGVTRETASRILAELESDGLIQIHEKNIIIIDEKSLRSLLSF